MTDDRREYEDNIFVKGWIVFLQKPYVEVQTPVTQNVTTFGDLEIGPFKRWLS